MYGKIIEAKPAALGYVFVSWLSTRANSAWDFWRSEGARDRPQTALKKTACGCCGRIQMGWYDRKVRRVRDLSCGDTRVFLELEVRRVECRRCGKVKRERLDFLADNPLYTKRFAYYVGRRCRAATIKEVAEELALDWHTVKALDMQYVQAQLERVGKPGPHVIGVDEISIRKGHSYRIVVSDLVRGRSIWFGGEDRSEASVSQFYAWLGRKKSSRIRLAVMDMWKPFRLATHAHAPQAAIYFVRQVQCHPPSGRGLGCGS
ncbi:MAG: transposase [Xanthobacteraceae bacterium]